MKKERLIEIVTSALNDRLCDGCKDTHSPYAYESCKGGSCDLCRSKAAEEVVEILNAYPECEDAVPWERLEKYAEWFCAQVSYPEFVREAKVFCESTISAMKGGNLASSTQSEQKKGKWVYEEHDAAMCDGHRCSECGFFIPWDYKHEFIDFINRYNFCPHCGADMRSDIESDT